MYMQRNYDAKNLFCICSVFEIITCINFRKLSDGNVSILDDQVLAHSTSIQASIDSSGRKIRKASEVRSTWTHDTLLIQSFLRITLLATGIYPKG